MARTGQPRKYFINVGDVIGDFICIDIIKDEKNETRAVMKCKICGRTKNVKPSTFLGKQGGKGTTHRSCGQYIKTANKKFHNEWCGMRSRTTNPNCEHYKDYGGRGINSDCWKYFIDFYDDMYESYIEACDKYDEKNVSLERIDVDGNYCKENCCWIHISEQKGNQRKTVYFVIIYPNGTEKCYKNIAKFSKDYGYNDSTINDLIRGKLKTAYGLRGYRITKDEYLQRIKCND